LQGPYIPQKVWFWTVFKSVYPEEAYKFIDEERRKKVGEEDPEYANGTLQKVFADALSSYIGKPSRGGRAISLLRDIYEKRKKGEVIGNREERKLLTQQYLQSKKRPHQDLQEEFKPPQSQESSFAPKRQKLDDSRSDDSISVSLPKSKHSSKSQPNPFSKSEIDKMTRKLEGLAMKSPMQHGSKGTLKKDGSPAPVDYDAVKD